MTAIVSQTDLSKPVRDAYRILRVAYTVVPVIAGIDQFRDKLANWDMYLAPLATRVVPIPPTPS